MATEDRTNRRGPAGDTAPEPTEWIDLPDWPELDGATWTAWASQAETDLKAAAEALLHPKACPWCGRPFDDAEEERRPARP